MYIFIHTLQDTVMSDFKYMISFKEHHAHLSFNFLKPFASIDNASEFIRTMLEKWYVRNTKTEPTTEIFSSEYLSESLAKTPRGQEATLYFLNNVLEISIRIIN